MHPGERHAKLAPTLRRPPRRRHGPDVVHPPAARPSKRAEGAAVRGEAHGHRAGLLVTPRRWAADYTYFVVYGSVSHLVDLRDVDGASSGSTRC